MKPPVFGRKQTPSAPPPPDHDPGHAAVLRRLDEEDRTDPTVRLKLAGDVVFDLVYRIVASERGARIEDLLGILGATGGFSCIAGVMLFLEQTGRTPEEVGMAIVRGDDGNLYYFGDMPNASLLESENALLSLTLGAAHALGAPVTLALVHEVMKHVAATVGGPEFGIPRLPPEHMPGDRPIEYVRHFWPKLREALGEYEVPLAGRTSAIGFAVQRAIDRGKQVLDPLLAARIVTEYAVPMAKIDPKRFD